MPWFFSSKPERAREAAKRRAAKLDKEIKRECKYYAKLIPKVLSNCGIDHIYPRADRPSLVESRLLDKKGRQLVKIVRAKYNDYAIYLWVDTRELPYRHELGDLHTDGVMETLSDACERQVVWRSVPGQGSWYVIWRDGAINAIPDLFSYDDAVAAIPANAGPLYFIAGVGENNRLVRSDLAKMPHYLVAGSTLMGKSVHLNQMLCQLIERNTPDRLQFLMIDLKGSEFNYYEQLPHLAWPIVTRAEAVNDALSQYKQIMADRMALFASRKCKDIEGFNNQFPNERLPYLVMVFDELALVLLHNDRKMALAASDLLASILSVSRSSGGHSIICTQLPTSNVVQSYIKVNVPERICFRVPSNQNSMVVIDMGLAANLPSVPGRAIHSRGPDLTEIQSPYVSNERIEKIVSAAIERGGGVAPRRGDEVTLQDVLDEAVDNFGGKLHLAPLYQTFRGRIGRDALEALIQGVNGDPLQVHGRPYKMQFKGHGRHGGRVLIPLDDRPGDAAAWPELPEIKPVKRMYALHSPHTILKSPSDPAAQPEIEHG